MRIGVGIAASWTNVDWGPGGRPVLRGLNDKIFILIEAGLCVIDSLPYPAWTDHKDWLKPCLCLIGKDL
jgi:hypothetical protein